MPSTLHKLYKLGKEDDIVQKEHLSAAVEDIEQKLNEGDTKVKAHANEVRDELRGRLHTFADQVANNTALINSLRTESREFCESSLEQLRGSIMESFDSLRANLEGRMDAQAAAHAALAETLGEDISKVDLATTSLEEQLRLQRSELDKHFKRELSNALENQAAEQERTMKGFENTLDSWRETVEQLSGERKALKQQRALVDRLEGIKAETMEQISSKTQEVSTVIHGHLDRHDAKIGVVEAIVTGELADKNFQLNQDLQRLREHVEHRLGSLDGGVAEVRQSVISVESAFSRWIEWEIPDAVRSATGPQGWLSQCFSAGGVADVQLELQVIPRPTEGTPTSKSKKEKDGTTERAMPIVLHVNLWAGGGVTFVFRVSVAGFTGPTQQNKFEQWGPAAAGRSWKLEDRYCREDGSLRVMVEILAASRTSDLSPTPLSLTPPPLSLTENTPSPEKVGQEPLQELPNQLPLVALPRVGNVCVHRHVEHRCEERMRSNMVRRIEWRLEQASGLAALFPKGECLVSNDFGASGMEGLQLVFFPQGCASAPSGYCSFFMRCKDVSLRAWMYVGKHRLEAVQEELQIGWFGRAKFWQCEKYIDQETDSVMLAVEVYGAPAEILQLHSCNDPRRSQKGFVEARPPSQPRVRASKKRPQPPPVSDSTLARGAQTTQWMTQAYVDSAQANKRGSSPGRQCDACQQSTQASIRSASPARHMSSAMTQPSTENSQGGYQGQTQGRMRSASPARQMLPVVPTARQTPPPVASQATE